MSQEKFLPSAPENYFALLNLLSKELASTNVNLLTADTLLRRNTITKTSKYITLPGGLVFFADAHAKNHLGLLEIAREVLHNEEVYPVDLGVIIGGGGFLDFVHGQSGDSVDAIARSLPDGQRSRRNGKDFNEQQYTEQVVKLLQTTDPRLSSIEINFVD